MGVKVVDRRDFLQTLGMGAAAFALPRGVAARAAADKPLEPLEFVFFKIGRASCRERVWR